MACSLSCSPSGATTPSADHRIQPMRFQQIETRLQGPMLLEPSLFRDERGFFAETYRHNEFAELGIAEQMVQDNHSRSTRGVVRGMHFQIGAGASKLVRC